MKTKLFLLLAALACCGACAADWSLSLGSYDGTGDYAWQFSFDGGDGSFANFTVNGDGSAALAAYDPDFNPLPGSGPVTGPVYSFTLPDNLTLLGGHDSYGNAFTGLGGASDVLSGYGGSLTVPEPTPGGLAGTFFLMWALGKVRFLPWARRSCCLPSLSAFGVA